MGQFKKKVRAHFQKYLQTFRDGNSGPQFSLKIICKVSTDINEVH